MAFGPSPDPATASGAGSLEHATEELYRIVPEVNYVHLALTLLSTFIVVFGLYSGFVKERLYVGEAIIATVIGIVLGNYAGGVFAPRNWSEGHHFDEVTLELTRIVIALAVFAVGVELPRAYVWRHRKSLTILLGPNMLIGWMLSAGFMYALIPSLEFLPALVVAAGVTPTDPILASSVVGKGKFAQDHVPSHIRHILQAESGCNDGAAFPFLYLALFLLLREGHSVGQAIGWWILLVFIYQIVLGVIIGAVVGIVARKLLKFSKRRRLIDRESMVAMYVALALFVTGATTLCGSDDLLAAFACGTAFAWDSFFLEAIEDSNFSSVIDLLANSAIFIYLGATMPFSAWSNDALSLSPWRLVIVAILILLFRRIPAIFAMQWFIPDVKTKREALFVGHFGPMGVGAIFISTLAASKLPTPNNPPENAIDILALSIQPITYFIVLSSILVHGLTISFFTLGRRVHSRVTSMTRTFTQASGNGDANEPSWMTRVKRIVPGQEIVINRDDDTTSSPTAFEKSASSDADAAEKGQLDTSTTPAPVHPMPAGILSSSSGGSSSSDRSLEKKEHEKEAEEKEHASRDQIEAREGGPEEIETGKTDAERENDENPPDNLLESNAEHQAHKERDRQDAKDKLGWQQGEHDREQQVQQPRSSSSASKTDRRKREEEDQDESSWKREARYCRAGHVKEWRDGRRIIVDRNDGGDVEVIEIDADDRAARKASDVPGRHVLNVPDAAIEHERRNTPKHASPERAEESAINKAAHKLLKAAMLKKDEHLTPQERERRRKEQEERDREFKREARYCQGQDREEGAGSGAATPRQWIEGDQVVEEGADDKVTVRNLTEDEKREQAQQHLAALRALGHPVAALEEKFGRLRSPSNAQPSSSTGSNAQNQKQKGKKSDLSLQRTERIEPPDEEDAHGRPLAPQRPEPTRRPSVVQRMKSALGAAAPASSAQQAGSPPRSSKVLKSIPTVVTESADEQQDEANESGQADDRGRPGRGRSPARPEPAALRTPARSPSPSRSIRFAELNRPVRPDSSEGGGSGPLSRLTGSGLRPFARSSKSGLDMRRTATAPDTSSPSIRFADGV